MCSELLKGNLSYINISKNSPTIHTVLLTVDAALHRSTVALVATGALPMAGRSTVGGVASATGRDAAPFASSLTATMERTLRRRELSCPPSSLLARDTSPREASAAAPDGGSPRSGGSPRALSASGAALSPVVREWARDEIATYLYVFFMCFLFFSVR